jgi:hypothetical protein
VTFLAPLWLAAAGIVGAALVVAHLFQRTVPPQGVLPTVRFVPETAPLTVLRSRRLTNVMLLLLRLAAVALLGLALAGAHITRRAPSHVVIADMSRAVASASEVIDSALSNEGALYIVADSAARRISSDSLRSLPRSSSRASLSAALVAAHRELADRATGHAASELVIVSALARESVDSATMRLLSLWDGPVRVVRVAAAAEPPPAPWEVRATGDDPVSAALDDPPAGPASVRVLRSAATTEDSLWAHNGGALVVWPRDGSGLLSRPAADTQGAIATSRDVVIGSFVRTVRPHEGSVLVRWSDGQSAATERLVGSGCIRDVAIPVDPVGDIALDAGFRGIARGLVEPCGGARDYQAVAFASRPALSAAGGFRPADKGTGKLPLWLALGAAALLLVEQFARNRERAVG